MVKVIRTSTVPISLNILLKGQLKFLNKSFNIIGISSSGNDLFNVQKREGIKTLVVDMKRNISPLSDFISLVKLYFVFKKVKPTIVHSITPKAGLLGILGARLAGTKKRIHIFTGQVWHTKKGIFKRLLMFIDKFIVWNATDILVDGESQRLFLIENNIVENDKSFVLGKGSISGVDTNRFVPNSDVRNTFRNEIGYQPDDVVFTFLGRMNIDKGMLELAVAFDKLSQKYDKVRLLFIGFDEENIEALMKKKVKNSEKVFFYGMTPSPEKIMQAGDVFCLPSYKEGFGTYFYRRF